VLENEIDILLMCVCVYICKVSILALRCGDSLYRWVTLFDLLDPLMLRFIIMDSYWSGDWLRVKNECRL